MHAPLRSQDAAPLGPAEEIEGLRAVEYGMLAHLLAAAPRQATLDAVAGLNGDATPLGRAHATLAEAAALADPREVAREHHALFIGVGRGEILPYASYYLTGFLNERPLAAVRRDLAALGLERTASLHDPEDHIAILCDAMAALARGQARAAAVDQRTFFRRHLEPWAGRLFEDLQAADRARFYRAVGAVGAAFVAIEAQAFALEDG